MSWARFGVAVPLRTVTVTPDGVRAAWAAWWCLPEPALLICEALFAWLELVPPEVRTSSATTIAATAITPPATSAAPRARDERCAGAGRRPGCTGGRAVVGRAGR